MAELLSMLVCAYVAFGLGFHGWPEYPYRYPRYLTRLALKWGIAIVTVPLLCVLGIAGYLSGEAMPSALSYVMCTIPCALMILNGRRTISWRSIPSSLALAAALTAVCFAALEGLPVAVKHISVSAVRWWALCCLSATLAMRIILRITEKA